MIGSDKGASAVEGIFGILLTLLMVFTTLQFVLICLGQSLALNYAYVSSRQELIGDSSGSNSLFKAGFSRFFQKNNSSVKVKVIMPMVDGLIGKFVTLKASVKLGQNPKVKGDNKQEMGGTGLSLPSSNLIPTGFGGGGGGISQGGQGMQFGMGNATQNGNNFSSFNQK
jgi:hypothetical protein